MHFFHVTDIDKFLAKTVTMEHGVAKNNYSSAKHCHRCLQPFYSEKKLEMHNQVKCDTHYFREILPQENNYGPHCEFTKHGSLQRAKLTIFADFGFHSSFKYTNCLINFRKRKK